MFRASVSTSRLFSRSIPNARASLISQRAAPTTLFSPRAARLASTDNNGTPPMTDHNKKMASKKLEPNPEGVSSTSTTRTGLELPASSDQEGTGNPDMAKELKRDIQIVQDTLSLANVPRESRILGLLGTLPYFGASLSTLYLAWDLHKPSIGGGTFTDMFSLSEESASKFIEIIEPLQLGYGAVIISFLGAIHWGLEFAEKSPSPERTRFRYGMGFASSIIAWPTLMMPFEFALTAQFMAFVGLYFADARATRKGWAPGWYGTYRFFLTLMVGLSILLSLVGRTKIEQKGTISYQAMASQLEQTGLADTETDWAKVEEEEKKKMKWRKESQRKEKLKKEKKEQDEKEEDDDDSDGNGGSEQGGDEEKSEEKGEEKSEDEGKDKSEEKGEEKGEAKSDDNAEK